MKSNDNIVLVGFMGTGKTSVAQKLAEHLGWQFVDSDHWIEAAESLTIPEIFKLKGEAYFRQAEQDAIRTIMQRQHQVIATGGGAVLAENNRTAMLEHGLVIALHANVDAIIERVSGDQNRPLLSGNLSAKVLRLVEERKHAYDFAPIQIDTTHLSIDEVVEQIIHWRRGRGHEG